MVRAARHSHGPLDVYSCAEAGTVRPGPRPWRAKQRHRCAPEGIPRAGCTTEKSKPPWKLRHRDRRIETNGRADDEPIEVARIHCRFFWNIVQSERKGRRS